uniref:F-box domain-containing protein n=1 Tax=Rhabditophanes sp. KR3021 TaxID=114890 RepID=A0AC35TYA7_9BILA
MNIPSQDIFNALRQSHIFNACVPEFEQQLKLAKSCSLGKTLIANKGYSTFTYVNVDFLRLNILSDDSEISGNLFGIYFNTRNKLFELIEKIDKDTLNTFTALEIVVNFKKVIKATFNVIESISGVMNMFYQKANALTNITLFVNNSYNHLTKKEYLEKTNNFNSTDVLCAFKSDQITRITLEKDVHQPSISFIDNIKIFEKKLVRYFPNIKEFYLEVDSDLIFRRLSHEQLSLFCKNISKSRVFKIKIRIFSVDAYTTMNKDRLNIIAKSSLFHLVKDYDCVLLSKITEPIPNLHGIDISFENLLEILGSSNMHQIINSCKNLITDAFLSKTSKFNGDFNVTHLPTIFPNLKIFTIDGLYMDECIPWFPPLVFLPDIISQDEVNQELFKQIIRALPVNLKILKIENLRIPLNYFYKEFILTAKHLKLLNINCVPRRKIFEMFSRHFFMQFENLEVVVLSCIGKKQFEFPKNVKLLVIQCSSKTLKKAKDTNAYRWKSARKLLGNQYTHWTDNSDDDFNFCDCEKLNEQFNRQIILHQLNRKCIEIVNMKATTDWDLYLNIKRNGYLQRDNDLVNSIKGI